MDKEVRYTFHVPYSDAIGSLRYATRLDISHAVSVIIIYFSCPEKCHWQAVKWILQYLRCTSNVGLEFGGNSDIVIFDRMRLLTMYVFTKCSILESYFIGFALYTTEAEYMAVTEAVK